MRKSSFRSLLRAGREADHEDMILHPDIARWLVVAEQERLAELAGRPHQRPGTVRHRRRPNPREGA